MSSGRYAISQRFATESGILTKLLNILQMVITYQIMNRETDAIPVSSDTPLQMRSSSWSNLRNSNF